MEESGNQQQQNSADQAPVAITGNTNAIDNNYVFQPRAVTQLRALSITQILLGGVCIILGVAAIVWP